ncbi:hypothetical protein PR048_015079 [Dryococelus australis]|uniref:Uncharacterized protein n=1 Tax=Dryococelus australis TaxID=614101 RepID=A0ABQ9HG70_9NEOP|nr:hypothetical protein PR048_015079 [Dryococelus australis]
MVIKSRRKSLNMQVEEDKKPKLKKAKISDSHEEITSMQGSSNDVNKDMPFSSSGEKPAGHLPERSVSNNNKTKEKIILPKTCMVIMRPISKAHLEALSRSPMKLLTTVSQKSPPRTKDTSIPSSVSSYLKLAPKLGTPTCNADQNVGVLIKVENGNNVTSAAMQSSVSNIVNQAKSGSDNTSSPRQPSSLSHPSPSIESHASPSLALAGSNFSNTPGCTTLTTSMARTSATTSVPVSSSESALQLLSPKNSAVRTVINTYSKIHPQVVCQTGDSSSPRTRIVKRIVWSPPVQYQRTTNSRTSDSEPTSLVSTSPKGESCKPGSAVPAITTSKVASCKPVNLISSSTSPKVASCISPNIVPITTTHKVASSPKVTSFTPPNIVPITTTHKVASSPKVTSFTTAKVVPTTNSSRIASCKAANVVPISTTTKVTSSQPGYVTTSSTSTPRCQTVNKLETTSSVQKFTRCQLVPTSQAVAFLSRTAARSRLIESVAALSQSSTAVASVESRPATVTAAVTSAESSVGITCPTLQTSQSFGKLPT